jgi:hypothetical protein
MESFGDYFKLTDDEKLKVLQTQRQIKKGKAELLFPRFYGNIGYSNQECKNGNWLKKDEIIKAINHILDDDKLVSDRLEQLLNYLK